MSAKILVTHSLGENGTSVTVKSANSSLCWFVLWISLKLPENQVLYIELHENDKNTPRKFSPKTHIQEKSTFHGPSIAKFSADFFYRWGKLREVNHSLEISGIPYKKPEISYAEPETPYKTEKSRTLNVEVIYPSANRIIDGIRILDKHFLPSVSSVTIWSKRSIPLNSFQGRIWTVGIRFKDRRGTWFVGNW